MNSNINPNKKGSIDAVPSLNLTRQIQIIQDQLQSLSLALHEKEVENRRLRNFVNDQQETHDKQEEPSSLPSTERKEESPIVAEDWKTSKIERLELQVQKDQMELLTLRDQVNDQRRSIIGLEIDLETHDLNYTNYFQEQENIERKAMEELFNSIPNYNDDDKHDSRDERQTSQVVASRVDETSNEKDGDLHNKKSVIVRSYLEQNHQQGQRIPQVVSKLIVDHAELEARYKRDRLESIQQLEIERQKNIELQSTVSLLRTQTSNQEQNGFSKIALPEQDSQFPTREDFVSANKVLLRRVRYLENQAKSLKDENRNLRRGIPRSNQGDTNAGLTQHGDDAPPAPSSHKEVNDSIKSMMLRMNSVRVRLIVLEQQGLISNDCVKILSEIGMYMKSQFQAVKTLQAQNAIKEQKINDLRTEATIFQVRSHIPQPLAPEGSVIDQAQHHGGVSSDGLSIPQQELEAPFQEQKVEDLHGLLLQKERELQYQRDRFTEQEELLLAQLLFHEQQHKKVKGGRQHGNPNQEKCILDWEEQTRLFL